MTWKTCCLCSSAPGCWRIASQNHAAFGCWDPSGGHSLSAGRRTKPSNTLENNCPELDESCESAKYILSTAKLILIPWGPRHTPQLRWAAFASRWFYRRCCPWLRYLVFGLAHQAVVCPERLQLLSKGNEKSAAHCSICSELIRSDVQSLKVFCVIISMTFKGTGTKFFDCC